jgi:LacI family transcriptional regulator
MTVSYVLNNKSGEVSEETRIRVLKAVRDLGYRPGALAQKDIKREVLTLGLIAGVKGDSLTQPGYYSSITEGIIAAADELEHNITLFSNKLLNEEPYRSLRVYCDGRCDGLFVLAPMIGSHLVAALSERGLPFVLIGDPGDNETCSCVDIDNIKAGYDAVEYLIQQGHRSIAFAGGPDFVRSCVDRLEGYHRALAAYGIPVVDTLIAFPVVREREHSVHWRKLLEQRPTAIFCWNDGAAVSIMNQLREHGLRVPTDISVIGIDDAPGMAVPNVLTTLRQPFRAIGKRVIEILVGHIRQEIPVPCREFFPTTLVARNTVGPPQKS